jgi:hypothetical protein
MNVLYKLSLSYKMADNPYLTWRFPRDGEPSFICSEVFWVVTPYNTAVGYRRFGETYCLHFHLEDGDSHTTFHVTLQIVTSRHSETSVPTTTLHGVTTEKTSTWMFTAVNTSNLIPLVYNDVWKLQNERTTELSHCPLYLLSLAACLSSPFSLSIKYQNHSEWRHFTLKMKTLRSAETLVSYHATTRRHNPNDLDLNLHRRENVKSGRFGVIHFKVPKE